MNPVALTDGGLIGFLGIAATVLVCAAGLWFQNRDQRRTLGSPNGGGSIAGDLGELRGEFTQRNADVDRRLAQLDAGQREILNRLPTDRTENR